MSIAKNEDLILIPGYEFRGMRIQPGNSIPSARDLMSSYIDDSHDKFVQVVSKLSYTTYEEAKLVEEILFSYSWVIHMTLRVEPSLLYPEDVPILENIILLVNHLTNLPRDVWGETAEVLNEFVSYIKAYKKVVPSQMNILKRIEVFSKSVTTLYPQAVNILLLRINSASFDVSDQDFPLLQQTMDLLFELCANDTLVWRRSTKDILPDLTELATILEGHARPWMRNVGIALMAVGIAMVITFMLVPMVPAFAGVLVAALTKVGALGVNLVVAKSMGASAGAVTAVIGGTFFVKGGVKKDSLAEAVENVVESVRNGISI